MINQYHLPKILTNNDKKKQVLRCPLITSVNNESIQDLDQLKKINSDENGNFVFRIGMSYETQNEIII